MPTAREKPLGESVLGSCRRRPWREVKMKERLRSEVRWWRSGDCDEELRPRCAKHRRRNRRSDMRAECRQTTLIVRGLCRR